MAKVGCWTCGGDWFVCYFLHMLGFFGDSVWRLAARVCGDVIDVFFWGWVDHIFDSKSRPVHRMDLAIVQRPNCQSSASHNLQMAGWKNQDYAPNKKENNCNPNCC